MMVLSNAEGSRLDLETEDKAATAYIKPTVSKLKILVKSTKKIFSKNCNVRLGMFNRTQSIKFNRTHTYEV